MSRNMDLLQTADSVESVKDQSFLPIVKAQAVDLRVTITAVGCHSSIIACGEHRQKRSNGVRQQQRQCRNALYAMQMQLLRVHLQRPTLLPCV